MLGQPSATQTNEVQPSQVQAFGAEAVKAGYLDYLEALGDPGLSSELGARKQEYEGALVAHLTPGEGVPEDVGQRLSALGDAIEELVEGGRTSEAREMYWQLLWDVEYLLGLPFSVEFGLPLVESCATAFVSLGAGADEWSDLISQQLNSRDYASAEATIERVESVLNAERAKLEVGVNSEGVGPGLARAPWRKTVEGQILLNGSHYLLLVSLGLPDLAREKTKRGRALIDGLDADYPAEDAAIWEAELADQECNLWVLLNQQKRRKQTAQKALDQLRSVGLLQGEGFTVSPEGSARSYGYFLQLTVPRLRYHAAAGDLLHLRISEADPEVVEIERRLAEVEAVAADLLPIAEPLGLQMDYMQVLTRCAVERYQLGNFELAQGHVTSGVEFLRELGIPKGSGGLPELGLTAIEARLHREAADTAQRRGTLEQLESGVARIFEAWDRSELREGGLGFLDFRLRRDALMVAIREAYELGELELAFELLVEAQVRGSLERGLGLEPCSLQEVREQLCGLQGGVVTLLLGQGELLMICVDSAGLEMESLPFGEHWLQRILALREAIALPRPGGDELSQSFMGLNGMLLGSPENPTLLARKLEVWEHVYLVGREQIEDLPVGCLTWKGAPLGLTEGLAYLPSMPLGVALSEGWRTADLKLPEVQLGYLDGSSVGLSDARLGDRAKRELEGSLPIDSAIIGEHDSLRDALGRTNYADHSFATLFVHGKLDLTRPRPSGLWIGPGPDDVLWCSDVAQMTSAQVMILSACGAARTFARVGDGGVSSLGGACIEAGARSVVLASADVPRDGTVALTTALQSELTRGVPVAEALRRAKASLAAEAGFSDPYHYANFHVLGLGHMALPDYGPTQREVWSSRRRIWILSLSALIVLVLGLGLVMRQRASTNPA